MGSELRKGKVGSKSLTEVFLRHPKNTTAPVNAVAGTVTLVLATQPTAGDTMTLGTKVYTFMADSTADEDGEIDVGADLADAKTLVIAAINGTDGNNTAHTLVGAGAFSTNDLPITALVKGVAGNAVVSTETFTAGGNVFGAVTLEEGVDGTDGPAWDTLFDGDELFINATDDGPQGVSTDTWRSIPSSLLSE